MGNLTAAEDKAREMEKMCERGVDWDLVEQSLSLDKKGVTLADIWEKFQKTGAWSESTKRQDRSTVENFILKTFPGSLNQITEAQIRGYLQRRSEEDGPCQDLHQQASRDNQGALSVCDRQGIHCPKSGLQGEAVEDRQEAPRR